MKIAFIRKKFVPYGGAERHAADFIDQLIKAGHEVHVFAAEWKEHPGIVFHKIPVIKAGSFFKTLSFALNARKALRRESFDIIQSNEKTLYQDVYRAGDGCHREWLIERGKYLSGLRNALILLNPFHRLMLRIEQRIFTKGNYKKIIAISKMGKREIMDHYGVPEEKIQVIYNGVDLELFHPPASSEEKNLKREQWGIGKEDLLILFVGSGFERKGLKFLLLALLEIEKRFKERSIKEIPNWKLMVCGKGKPGVFHALLERSGLKERVIFTGIVQDREHYFRAADIFAFPTIYEPFGNVHLEALASGLPVITTAKSGAAEIITETKQGYIINEPSDVLEIAGKLLLLMNSERRKEISAQTRLLAEQFTLERNTSEVVELYHSVIEEKSQRKK